MFVAKKEEMVLLTQTHTLYAPRFPFSQSVTSGNEMAQNHHKHEFGQVRCEKRRKGSGGTNSFLVCT